jgi:NTP pyrophosphatase (non-canonical NTP hydrolase)
MNFKEFQVQVQRTLPDLHKVYHVGGLPTNKTAIEELSYLKKNEDGTNNFINIPEVLNLVHTRMGMVSEISELMKGITNKDKVNVGEELGDQLWYIANDLTICNRMGFLDPGPYNEFSKYTFGKGIQATDGGVGNTLNEWFNAIVYNSCELVDYSKKYLAYGKPMDQIEYIRSVGYLLGAINNLAFSLKIDLDEYMEKIIQKLRKRYPNKFDADQAINRDTTAERVILDGIPDAASQV